MEPEHFFCMFLGAMLTLAIQYYGRRKVKQATTAPDHARSSAREWTIQPILILGELCIAPES